MEEDWRKSTKEGHEVKHILFLASTGAGLRLVVPLWEQQAKRLEPWGKRHWLVRGLQRQAVSLVGGGDVHRKWLGVLGSLS